MYLFKCSCDCFFSMKDLTRGLICPNCDNAVSITRTTSYERLQELLQKKNMTMQIIPDDAKVNISFDL